MGGKKNATKHTQQTQAEDNLMLVLLPKTSSHTKYVLKIMAVQKQHIDTEYCGDPALY